MDNSFSSATQASLLLNLADAASSSNFSLDTAKAEAALGYQLAQLGERLGDHMSYLTMFEPSRIESGIETANLTGTATHRRLRIV